MSEAIREQATNGYCHCVIVGDGKNDFCGERTTSTDQPFCDPCEQAHPLGAILPGGGIVTVWMQGPDGKRVVRMP